MREKNLHLRKVIRNLILENLDLPEENNHFFRFNSGNIYDMDKVAEFRSRIRRGEQLKPADVYYDDDGSIFVIDGHHRILASLLEDIYPKMVETEDENAVMGIGFMSWESFDDVWSKLNKKKGGGNLSINEDYVIDEMAYPESFNFEEFKAIESFAGKQKYARQHLLGKVGAGSSRAVFKVDDEKVIKIALNKKGLQQNMVEAEGYKQNYDVLARVFDVDDDDMWVEMELAKKVSASRFKSLVGASPEEVVGWLCKQKGEECYWGKDLADLGENEFVIDLQTFVFDYDYPLPGDFNRLSTYGEVVRDGKPTIVVVDFGYDSGTQQVYKTSLKKKYAY